MNGKCYVTLTAVIFLLVAILHLLRLIYCTQVMIGDCLLPYWVSWAGLIGATALFVWAVLILRSDFVSRKSHLTNGLK